MSVMNLFGGQGVCGASGLVQALLGVELAAPASCFRICGSVAVLQKSLKRSATPIRVLSVMRV